MVVLSEAASYKMVISSDTNIDNASDTLNSIEKFFQENTIAKSLKQKHDLQLKLELLNNYVLTVIRPIDSKSLKNNLEMLLSPRYPKMFIVKEESAIYENKNNAYANHVNQQHIVGSNNSYVEGITDQWLLFIVLTLLGFLLVYVIGSQILKIKNLQKKLENEQDELDVLMGNIEGTVS